VAFRIWDEAWSSSLRNSIGQKAINRTHSESVSLLRFVRMMKISRTGFVHTICHLYLALLGRGYRAIAVTQLAHIRESDQIERFEEMINDLLHS
jgi:hypothetical protein